MKKKLLVVVGLIGTLTLAACQSDDSSGESSETSNGTENGSEADSEVPEDGELRIAFNPEPPTLDPIMSTATATRDIASHFYETLVTLDEDFEAVPWLAESYEENEDNTEFTFYLREGVQFHNGDEMTADDVVASMERWFSDAANAHVEELGDATITADDEYTVTVEINEPSSVAVLGMANPGQIAAIMPADIAESAGPEGVTEHIGTGPYQMEEWAQDQHVHLTRFEEYENHPTPTTGFAAEKTAPSSDIYFEFVTDPSTRLTGIQTGEYDLASSIPFDNVDQLEQDPNVVTSVDHDGFNAAVFNKKEGVFSDQTARQAANAALDMEAILQASLTSEEFYTLSHDYMTEDQEHWYSEAGQDLYNQNDPELAQELMEEFGYDGEEVVILTSRDDEDYYNAAVVIQQQLEAAGMNAVLDVYDWSTVHELRGDPSNFDIFITGFPTEPTPTQYIYLNSGAGWDGWTDSEEIDQHLQDIRAAADQEEAQQAYAELQEEIWTYLPAIRFGDKTTITAMRDNVEGFDFLMGMYLWNTYVNE